MTFPRPVWTPPTVMKPAPLIVIPLPELGRAETPVRSVPMKLFWMRLFAEPVPVIRVALA